MRRLLTAVMAVLGSAGCGAFSEDPHMMRIVCSSDAECSADEVCFADGCGDPGKNIVVEVRPNPQAGLHEQDFPVENLRPRHNLELFGPASIQGHVLRQSDTDAPGLAYTQPITVRATGESLLIPGVQRLYSGTFTPANGDWALKLGTGTFTITLQAADLELPPLEQTLTVEPGWDVPLDFTLPSITAVTRLAGRLVRQGDVRVDADLEIQALDASQHPLSQRVPVSRLTGDFLLVLPPSAAQLTHVLLQVTRSARSDALVPQKTFSVELPKGLAAPLEMGDYGEPVVLNGRAVDSAGRPVAGATVYVMGKVGGGGTFRSASVTTGADGLFTLRSLPSPQDAPMSLFVVPPAEALAGLTRQSTLVPRGGVSLADVRCPDKLEVRGVLLRPEGGLPAAGAQVVAYPVGELAGWPLPSDSVAGITDADGRFSLRLDPGEYRFDFSTVENLPRVSRFVTARPGEMSELVPFTLSKGRSITGQVTMREDAGERSLPVAYANLRFFRVVHVEGKLTSVLLAQATADSTGSYAATLPTR
ncbi:carboxypeptidase regulatory-like domain-containing protein [Myxococcaceae bacterium GXIMD 01537]